LGWDSRIETTSTSVLVVEGDPPNGRVLLNFHHTGTALCYES
jgi:hypothetical protein